MQGISSVCSYSAISERSRWLKLSICSLFWWRMWFWASIVVWIFAYSLEIWQWSFKSKVISANKYERVLVKTGGNRLAYKCLCVIVFSIQGNVFYKLASLFATRCEGTLRWANFFYGSFSQPEAVRAVVANTAATLEAGSHSLVNDTLSAPIHLSPLPSWISTQGTTPCVLRLRMPLLRLVSSKNLALRFDAL